MNSPLGTAWRAARLPTGGLHLDSAACGQTSLAVHHAMASHVRHEAELGGYVAEVAAEPALSAARAAVGVLLGYAADEVVFAESGSTALAALLRSWPLGPGARVGMLDSEWGPNLAAVIDVGWSVVRLPGDADGHLDLAAFSSLLGAERLDLVLLTQVAGHRGLVQPAAAAVELAHAAGVPIIIDACQALGHVEAVTAADATYATSRKWIAGPRGVGVLAVRTAAAETLIPQAPQLIPASWPMAGPWLRRWESPEANVAGRVGLAVALSEHLAHGSAYVAASLAGVGRRTRLALEGVGGWQVVEQVDEPCSTTTLRPPTGVDVAAVRAGLVTAGIVTTVSGVARAPRAMSAPTLRVSPHVDVTDAELAAFARALVGASG